jgi:hypothetical protein
VWVCFLQVSKVLVSYGQHVLNVLKKSPEQLFD